MDDRNERVVLVDPQGRDAGTADKLEAHRAGVLHRAFSIFVFNAAGEVLLQRRAAGKYHSPGLWSNTCCGHPRPDEDIVRAAERRLAEELGFTCPLTERFAFTYRCELADGLVEHEWDHVLVGRWDGPVRPDPDEVGEVAWLAPEAALAAIRARPESHTVWLSLIAERMLRDTLR